MVRKDMTIWVALFVAVALLVSGCGNDDALSQAEVDEAIAQAIAELPERQSGLTAADMEEAIRSAFEELPSPEEGVSMAEVQQAIQEAIDDFIAGYGDTPPATANDDAGAQNEPEEAEVAAPPKSDPAAYTRYFVESAIAMYDAEGLEATLAHYNSPDSVDGQWYLFIVDRNAEVIGHYEPDRLGLNLLGFAGTDANGYKFGPEMLSATTEGKWVGYVYRNPATGRIGVDSTSDFELKNAWVVNHDGLLFGSGWHINIDEFILTLTDEIAERLRSSGFEATIAHYRNPQNLAEGLQGAVEYYNTNATADGTWLGFYADPDGTVLFHNDPAAIGSNIADLLGPAVLDAPARAAWITESDNPAGQGPLSMRIRAFNQDGIIFGTGWYQPDKG